MRAGGGSMSKLIVGCYSLKSPLYYGRKYTDIVGYLRQAVEYVDLFRAANVAHLATDSGFQAIFAASEYMFTGENTTATREPMSASERGDVVRDIEAISKDFPKILIFPGTIFYKEQLSFGKEPYKKSMANLIAASLQATNFGKSKLGPAKDSVWKPAPGHTWEFDRGATNVMAGFQAGMAANVHVPGMIEVSKAFQGPKPDLHRAYNCVQAFLGGKPAFGTPYLKNWDYKETEGASVEHLIYIPGTAAGRRTIGKFEFGIEVCFDHFMGALKGSTADVDFHVVVSDCVATKVEHMAMKRGGYFIHASSDPNQTMVCRKGAMIERLAPVAGAIDEDSVACWVIDSPLDTAAPPPLPLPPKPLQRRATL
jgi:hypothetical protein